MKVGGVQKSLCNLLQSLDESCCDVTLLLFCAEGTYMKDIPAWVRVVECDSLFRYMAIGQKECNSIKDKMLRGVLAGICRFFGRSTVMPLIVRSQKKLSDSYDCAISFLHNGRKEAFYGGTQEFVLQCVKADRKVAFLHCDYGECGANNKQNNYMIEQFDKIAACSEGCRRAFLRILPNLENKCVTVKNCHQFDKIVSLANENTVKYGDGIHVLMVSRIAPEKGIDRAMKAVEHCRKLGKDITLHIVGGGAKQEQLMAKAQEYEVKNNVIFYGEQANPYRYMKNANLLLIASKHEAAPMVIDEAVCLDMPVLTVRTTSSDEMVAAPGVGWVCENDQQSLNNALFEVADKQLLMQKKKFLSEYKMDNSLALSQFNKMLDE